MVKADHVLKAKVWEARRFLEQYWPSWQAPGVISHPPSRGKCGRSSSFLCLVLRADLDLPCALAMGAPERGTLAGFFDSARWIGHCWVQTADHIIDLTADQFGLDPVTITALDDHRYRPGRDTASAEAISRRAEVAHTLFRTWQASAPPSGTLAQLPR